jgi:nicotinamidase-related amidase
MPALDRNSSLLLVVDFQARLMPAIDSGTTAVGNALRLLRAAETLGVPILFTEENSGGLGPTVPDLAPFAAGRTAAKMSFNACREIGFLDRLGGKIQIIVAGCEAHVCVLQTALGLLGAGKRVYLVRDAVGSRRVENKEAAIRRLERHGADIVTTEMVVFEWLGSAGDPAFRAALDLVR